MQARPGEGVLVPLRPGHSEARRQARLDLRQDGASLRRPAGPDQEVRATRHQEQVQPRQLPRACQLGRRDKRGLGGCAVALGPRQQGRCGVAAGVELRPSFGCGDCRQVCGEQFRRLDDVVSRIGDRSHGGPDDRQQRDVAVEVIADQFLGGIQMMARLRQPPLGDGDQSQMRVHKHAAVRARGRAIVSKRLVPTAPGGLDLAAAQVEQASDVVQQAAEPGIGVEVARA